MPRLYCGTPRIYWSTLHAQRKESTMLPPAAIPSRRDLLRVGALGAAGLAFPDLLRGGESRPLADSCILLFCLGAPSQFETFHPKPDAPDGIRGEFRLRPPPLPALLFLEHF